MNTIAPLPGYKAYDFLLVLNPHQDLQQRIHTIKKEFSKKYKTPVAQNTKAHITLVKFTTLGMMEERLVQRLQLIAMGVAPFKVELSNFGSFPSHTIFINVTTKVSIKNVVKGLKEAQRLLKINNDNKPHFIDEPHLSVCRRLKPWQFEEGWLEYSHKHFTGRFIADSMLLLKRPEGEKGSYQIAKRFEFMNLPVTTKQGELFG